MKGYSWFGGVLLCVFAVMQQASADDKPRDFKCATDCVAVGQWQFNLGLGLGMRQNPLEHKSDTPLIVLPEISYYGQRFFFKNLEFGFTLFENRRHQFHLLATPSIDQMYFNRWDPLNFTDSGGFASTFSPAAPSVPVGQQSRSYSVFVREATSAQPDPDMGAAPPPADEGIGSGSSSSSPGIVGDSGASSSSSSSLPSGGNQTSSGDGVLIDGSTGIATLDLNGDQIIRGVNASVEGRGGNTILINWADDETLSIEGLIEKDVLRLYGEDIVFTSVTDAQQIITAGSVSLRATSASASEAAPESNNQSESQAVTREIDARRAAGLAGVEYLYSRSWLNLHLQGLTDVTGVHHGQEWRLAMIFPVQYQNHRWAATLGANYQSDKVVDYYYGLREHEVAHPSQTYQVDRGGWSQMLRLDWQMALSRRWSLRAMAQYKYLNGDIRRSPMVSETGVGSVFVGGIYHF